MNKRRFTLGNSKWFTSKNSKGYTLIEVSLFLGISGLLSLIAFAGLGPRLRNVRFTAAVRAVQSSSQNQLTHFTLGLNPSATNPGCQKQSSNQAFYGYKVEITGSGTNTAGTNANCILNGRLAVFRANKISYYTIASLTGIYSSDPDCPRKSGFEKILCHGPTVLNGNNNFRLDVGYQNGVTNGASSLPSAIGYIQDPDSTQVYTFIYTKAAAANNFGGDIGGAPLIRASDLDSTATLDTCLVLGARNAKLTYSKTSLQPEVNFDTGCN